MTSNAQGEQPREQHCHCHGEAQAAASQPRSRAELDKSLIQAHVACSLFCIAKVLNEAIDEAIVIHGYPLLASAGVSAAAQRPVRYVSVTCALEADLPVVLLAAVLRIAKVWHWCVRRERQSANRGNPRVSRVTTTTRGRAARREKQDDNNLFVEKQDGVTFT